MPPQRSWIPEAIRLGQDPDSGAEIEQLTSDAVTSTNIYLEQRYTSADGSRIALTRTPFGRPTQIWVCDLRTFRLCFIGEGKVLGSSHRRNALYYSAADGSAHVLMRLDFTDLTTATVLRFPDNRVPSGGGISPDEKWLIGGPFVSDQDDHYELSLFDLATGTCETICREQDMSNPHAQFDPAGSGRCIIQINRAAHRQVPGVEEGTPGATLAILDVGTGQVTPLPVGRPWTPRVSGHECWIGQSGRLIFSAGRYDTSPTSYVTLHAPPKTDAPEVSCPDTALYGIGPGDAAPAVIAQGRFYNHVSASDDGRFFVADDHATGTILIGGIDTGHSEPLCQSHTRQGTCQYSHVHPYMTPDQRYVIFNSIATGVAQVYAARIPEGFLTQQRLVGPSRAPGA